MNGFVSAVLYRTLHTKWKCSLLMLSEYEHLLDFFDVEETDSSLEQLLYFYDLWQRLKEFWEITKNLTQVFCRSLPDYKYVGFIKSGQEVKQ